MAVKKKSVYERWIIKVEKIPECSCWIWNAALNTDGYGCISDENGKTILAYKWGYEHFIGPYDSNLVLDHLCKNKQCVNPFHLEPVTYSENILRGSLAEVLKEKKLNKTHCRNGHLITPVSYVFHGPSKKPRCTLCEKERVLRRKEERHNKELKRINDAK